MRQRALFLVALLAGLCPSLAIAQETGTLITRRAAQIDSTSVNGARRAMEDFAACLVAREKGRVATLIDLPVDTKESDKAFDAIFGQNDECLSDGQLRLNELGLRGAIFQALYKRDYATSNILAFPPEVQTGYRDLYPAELSEKARMYVSLNHFSECVTRADPSAVRQLITSQVGSSTETTTFAALLPKLSACIVKDNEIRFSKGNLKGFLAEGIYRLSRASAQKAAGQ
jgi:hypothetical protein